MSINNHISLNTHNKNKIYVIFGATASGKSKIAIKLAHKINGVIINADSSQIYHQFPILSNIPNSTEQEGIPHKLFAIRSILDDFNVLQWLKLVHIEIEEAKKNNQIPIVVGGTGLYLKALIEGISDIPSDVLAKNQAQQLYENMGYDSFFNLIANIDPNFTNKIKDPHRLIRMYEVFLITNTSILTLQQNKIQFIKGNFINFFINKNKEELYKSINNRFIHMLDSGAINEVKHFMNEYPNAQMRLKKILGALPIYNFLNGTITYEQLIQEGSQQSRHYAKRQLTWYRGNFLDNFKILNF